MDMEVVVGILTNMLTTEQLKQFLNDVSAANLNGYCPICGNQDVPVDKDGKVISGDDWGDAEDMREQHDDKCPVTMIEAFLPERAAGKA